MVEARLRRKDAEGEERSAPMMSPNWKVVNPIEQTTPMMDSFHQILRKARRSDLFDVGL